MLVPVYSNEIMKMGNHKPTIVSTFFFDNKRYIVSTLNLGHVMLMDICMQCKHAWMEQGMESIYTVGAGEAVQ